jgi:Zn-dependent M28 family amino/carboxypeptidase
MKVSFFSLLVPVIILAGCGVDPIGDAEKIITENFIMGHTRYLSHDLMEGRGPGTRGDDLARYYIAAQYEALGLEPGGTDGTYFQSVPLVGSIVASNTNLTVSRGNRVQTFIYRQDFVPFSGVQNPTVPVAGEMVFVGYGIVAPEYDWDDYKGKDMTGRILVMLNDDPGTEDTPEFFGGKARTYYGRWTYKYEIAAEVGAAGAIIIHTTPSAGYPFTVVQNSWGGENFELQSSDDLPTLAVKAWTSEEASREILQMAGFTLEELQERALQRDFEPIDLNLRASTTIRQSVREVNTYNVLGILRGGDSSMNDQAVVYTAHYDHFGIGEPVDGDSIYNGALDNAVGVAMTLAIAKAFTELPVPPHRSILFAAVGAEEFGLLGSEYYVRYPTFPHGKIAACINIDGGNIYAPTSDVIFLGAERSTIGEIVDKIAWKRRLTVEGDQFPEQGSFYRSDHFSFAKAGIPAVSLRTGSDFIGKPDSWGREQVETYIAKHYHQPSDVIRDEWDLRGVIDQARFCFQLGWEIALQREMPAWYPGDEFEAVRRASLRE